jgi:S-adenosylmethionine:tRNA ribosyltransferase-isomerase
VSRIPPEFTVTIPDDRIAFYPTEPRDQCKLLVLDRGAGKVVHVGKFVDLIDYLRNDLLVLNETRVIQARVQGARLNGCPVIAQFTRHEKIGKSTVVWALIHPRKRQRLGSMLEFPGSVELWLVEKNPDGGWICKWKCFSGLSFEEWLEKYGEPPLPPYIKRPVESADKERYQTVYATRPGSVAAPTAGLHFTTDLLNRVDAVGTEIARLSLDVGWGTFKPINEEDLRNHKMHAENYFISAESADAVRQAQDAGRRIIAVGTTTMRALEAAAQASLPLRPGPGSAELFIYPPYRFRVVTGVITNFHRPDSTLLQLIAAMTGWELLNQAYQRAVEEGFKFYSYGDAMLIV